MPLHNRRSLPPSDDPCERFSRLRTYITPAFQPRGSFPRISARDLAFARPRPTAAWVLITIEAAACWDAFEQACSMRRSARPI